MNSKIKVGISRCLLGDNVRYDGGNKRDIYIAETLGKNFDWVSVCPELEAGLGVPRPTIRLEDISGKIHLIQAETAADLTNALQSYSERRVRELSSLDLSGYILKSKSPSCGKGDIPIYNGTGLPLATSGVGIFAKQLIEAFPGLPIEDEIGLSDPMIRADWIDRVYAFHRIRRSQ